MRRNRVKSTTESQFTDEAVRNIVRRIIPIGGDEVAHAFVALINAVAYNADSLARDTIALCACQEAYRATETYGKAEMEFFAASKAEFPVAA